jgi:hypothetical protein
MSFETITYECANGGTFTYRAGNSAFGGGSGSFDDCSLESLLDGGTINGEYSRSQQSSSSAFTRFFSSTTTFTNLTSVAPSGDLRTFSGTVRFSRQADTNTDPSVFNVSEALSDISFFSSGGADTSATEIEGSSNLLSAVISEDPSAILNNPMTYETFITLTSPNTGDMPLSVRTVTPFGTLEPSSVGDNRCYETGSLEITAEDGSAMIMQVDNGDPDTFQLDVNALNGSTSLTIPWAERFEPSRFPVSTPDSLDSSACTR